MTMLRNIPGTLSLTEEFEYTRPLPREADPAERAAIENERKIKRAELRTKIAEHKLLDSEYARLTDTIDEVNQQKESLAAEHVAACAPLQAELAKIEKKLVTALANKETTDAKAEARRWELLADIQKLNGVLAGKIAAEDRLLAETENQRREIGMKAAKLAVESDLIDYARPDLLVAIKVAQHTVEWAERRLRSAQEKIGYIGRTELLTAELKAAEAALEAARQEQHRAYEAVINE
jgi:hypothetical protein